MKTRISFFERPTERIPHISLFECSSRLQPCLHQIHKREVFVTQFHSTWLTPFLKAPKFFNLRVVVVCWSYFSGHLGGFCHSLVSCVTSNNEEQCNHRTCSNTIMKKNQNDNAFGFSSPQTLMVRTHGSTGFLGGPIKPDCQGCQGVTPVEPLGSPICADISKTLWSWQNTASNAVSYCKYRSARNLVVASHSNQIRSNILCKECLPTNLRHVQWLTWQQVSHSRSMVAPRRGLPFAWPPANIFLQVCRDDERVCVDTSCHSQLKSQPREPEHCPPKSPHLLGTMDQDISALH